MVRLRRGQLRCFAFLWERGCSRWRPDSRPAFEVVLNPTVGAAEGCDLLILILILLLLFCGSEPARDDGGTFKFNLEDLPLSLAGSFLQGFVP